MTHPYLAHVWAERGVDLRVQAPRRNAQRLRPGQARKVAIPGVLDAMTRVALVHTSPTKRSNDFTALLERLDRTYGPVQRGAGITGVGALTPAPAGVR